MKFNLFVTLSMATLLVHGPVANAYRAGEISAPTSLPSAKVLPKGVKNFDYSGIISARENKRSSSGAKTALDSNLYSQITYGELMKQISPSEQGEFEAAMIQSGATESDSFGKTTGDINVEVESYIPSISYGITDKLTIGVSIPIVSSRVRVDTGVVHENPAIHDSFQKTYEGSGSTAELENFNKRIQEPINANLARNNYQPLKDERKTDLGDIQLFSKYNLFADNETALSLLSVITLPTGKQADVNKFVDVSSGDGQTDLQLGLVYDLYWADGITFSTGASYTMQIKDTVAMRVPESKNSIITPDSDGGIKRDLGDIIRGEVALKYNFIGINLGVGLAAQVKSRDSYQGNNYSNQRYRWLEEDTEQSMQTATVSIGYETTELYKQDIFFAPLALTIGHTRVLAGKNVIDDPVTTLDFSMLF